ncbi:MAG: GGDEF domain-containing protein [Lachnospiraceae bacterium]|nr:GGDEF domain-containing protein [Lachnospiraceae bacterium]
MSRQSRKGVGLVTRFTIIFSCATLLILILAGFVTYNGQMRIYKKQCEANVRNIGEYLEIMLEAEGNKIKVYQDSYIRFFNEVDIPYDFDSFKEAEATFRKHFAEEYPNKALWVDVEIKDMPEWLQKEWLVYYHEYWIITFEQARTAFDLPYTYYLLMKEDIHNVVYMIDGERTRRQDDGNLLYLGDEYYNDPEVYKFEWKTWKTKQKQNGYQEWDNAWGHTYAYYTPLTIDGETLGLIGTEVEVAKVNKDIMNNTLSILMGIAIALIGSMLIMLGIINKYYISKLARLETAVGKYTASKDPSTAADIEKDGHGSDEISSLARQFVALIVELENYIKNLVKTTQELQNSKRREQDMSELANKDSLTGVRNRTAYDALQKELVINLNKGDSRFGFAMIDLNGLKQINDTYGHDKGNVSIKKLCNLVCTVFAHSPVFRVGGDEFVVVLRGNDYNHSDELAGRFNIALAEIAKEDNMEPWEKISAAIGIAKYDAEIDSTVESVLKRADELMYIRKQEMKCLNKQET